VNQSKVNQSKVNQSEVKRNFIFGDKKSEAFETMTKT